MEQLRELVSDYSDEKLLEVYRIRHSDYTEAAVKIIEEEVARRGLNADKLTEAHERTELAAKLADAAVCTLKQEDFVPLPHPFSKADILIADAILRDSKVPYIIERWFNPANEKGAVSLDITIAEARHPYARTTQIHIDKTKLDGKLFIILAYNDALDTARALIEEHFEADAASGMYIRRFATIADRLLSFNLSDITFSPIAAEERLDVDFADNEKKEIIKLAEILLAEIDAVEEKLGRMVFYYDNLEVLAEKLKGQCWFTRIDFLTIIELCQIYCNDPRYNSALDHAASSILDFFLA